MSYVCTIDKITVNPADKLKPIDNQGKWYDLLGLKRAIIDCSVKSSLLSKTEFKIILDFRAGLLTIHGNENLSIGDTDEIGNIFLVKFLVFSGDPKNIPFSIIEKSKEKIIFSVRYPDKILGWLHKLKEDGEFGEER